jgi:peptidoglycan/LPS O-acetylase OafA/YrhL
MMTASRTSLAKTGEKVGAIIRTDIQALRALAVMGVLAFHYGDGILPGGFVGVDVFFVISGYLIGGILVRELHRTGRVSLSEFYARRARRILPMGLLVIVATIIAASAFASPLRMLLWGRPLGDSSILKDGIAATLYAPNLWFAAQHQDYLADDAVSPFLHFWSLGIEEQFYVVVPLALLACFIVTRKRLSTFSFVVAAGSAASFAYGLGLSYDNAVLAYFHPGARAWELGAGVTLAAAIEAGWRAWSPRAGRLVATAGLMGIFAVMVWAPFAHPWPGWGAVLPVLFTMALIWGGTGERDVRGWWSFAPIQHLGDWSYSLYLWHWPVWVFAALLLGRNPSGALAVGLALACIGVSAASFRWIEIPARRMDVRTPRSRRRVFIAAAMGIAATLVIAGAVAEKADVEVHRTFPAATPYSPPPVPTTGATPLPRDIEFALVLPSNLRPAIEEVSSDVSRVYADGCHLGRGNSSIPPCTYGDSGPVVAVFGDSHAAQWVEAFASAADAGRLTLVALTASSCGPMALPVDPNDPVNRTDCDPWRDAAIARLVDVKPDVIVMSVLDGYVLQGGEDPASVYAAGLAETLDRLPAESKVVFLSDTPSFASSPAQCAADHPDDLAWCAGDPSVVFDEGIAEAVRSVVESRGGTYVNLTPFLCNTTECGVVIGDILVYRDSNHITATFAREFSPVLLGLAGVSGNGD